MEKTATYLTKHGVRSICENKVSSPIILQVIDINSIENKNLCGKMTLSDGHSTIISMLSNKTKEMLDLVKAYHIVQVDVNAYKLQMVKER